MCSGCVGDPPPLLLFDGLIPSGSKVQVHELYDKTPCDGLIDWNRTVQAYDLTLTQNAYYATSGGSTDGWVLSLESATTRRLSFQIPVHAFSTDPIGDHIWNPVAITRFDVTPEMIQKALAAPPDTLVCP